MGTGLGVSGSTYRAVVERMEREAVVPPFIGMEEAVVAELTALPMTALGELRDMFRP